MDEFRDLPLRKLLEIPQICKRAFFYDVFKRLQEELKMSKTQLFTLLHAHIGGEYTMSDLADNLGIENSSLTTVIANLTERGYAAKQINENDRRKAQLILTEEGKQISAYIYKEYSESVNNTLNMLSEEEQEAFLYHVNGLCVLSKQIIKKKE